MSTTTMTIRTDTETKHKAQLLFKELGMDMTTAINVFLKQAIRHQGLPFEVRMEIPNELTDRILRETAKGDELSAPFDTVESLMEDLHA